MIKIKIDGQEYDCVASLEPSVIYDEYYNVKTLDGRLHRDLKGRRTNFDIVFCNKDFDGYDALKKKLLTSPSVELEVPVGSTETIKDEFLVTVENDNLKGLLYRGIYYSTGLAVHFEKVGYDE